jgi:hypothetical protein
MSAEVEEQGSPPPAGDDLLTTAPPNFQWGRFPETEAFLDKQIQRFLGAHPFAAQLAQRMREESSTLLPNWVDYLVVPQQDVDADQLETKFGFQIEHVEARQGETVYWHPHAHFPRLVLSTNISEPSAAINVESIEDFMISHQLSLPIEGAVLSTYRVARLPHGNCELLVTERRGYRGYLPQTVSNPAAYLAAKEAWMTRQRKFDDEQLGMRTTLLLAQKLAHELGQDLACHVVFECERAYWQKRNTAACVQKLRQDHLGLGWANHDHHTYRSSRVHFPALIRIFKTLGFKLRERYYAGTEAGWGAQIVEQPACGIIVFSDLDLTPEDTSVDFASTALPPTQNLGTVGLWCALHGESMLQAGMHHLEAQFDFEGMKNYLESAGLRMMEPFSNFSYLKQAFSKGEIWPVDEKRLQVLLGEGKLSQEQCDRYLNEGAIGSHLENLQRTEGYKGFNQKNVSNIIQATDPRLHHLVHDA